MNSELRLRLSSARSVRSTECLALVHCMSILHSVQPKIISPLFNYAGRVPSPILPRAAWISLPQAVYSRAKHLDSKPWQAKPLPIRLARRSALPPRSRRSAVKPGAAALVPPLCWRSRWTPWSAGASAAATTAPAAAPRVAARACGSAQRAVGRRAEREARWAGLQRQTPRQVWPSL